MRLPSGVTSARGATTGVPSARSVVSALGVAQILAWGSSYYLLAVLAPPIARDTGWSMSWVVGGLSIGLLVAGAAAPMVGRRIQKHGGRPVLMASAVLLAAGLSAIGLAGNLPAYLAGWVLLGLGMAAGLYDAAFSALGRTFGLDARRHITTLTIFGGFASTLCWPLTSLLLSALGWRGACFVYAGILLFVCLLYALVLPREARVSLEARASQAASGSKTDGLGLVFAILSVSAALSALISTVVSVHLLVILQSRDMALSAAVALGALVGPSQVGARIAEMAFGRRHHPIWAKLTSVVLVAAGLFWLWSSSPAIGIALVLYGAGIGLESIARASLPLVVFGSDQYSAIMGRMARPSLIAKAAAPSIGATMLTFLGADGALAALWALAALNVAIVAVLYWRLGAKSPVLKTSRL